MSIAELGSLGEFVAALATIGTLFYLGYQIRESSKVAKGSSYHQAVEQTWQAVLAVVNGPEIRDVIYRIQRGEEISDPEFLQLIWLNIAMVYGFENIYKLREEGLVDEEVWQNLLRNELCIWFAIPQNWEYLLSRKGTLASRFREEVKSAIEEASFAS